MGKLTEAEQLLLEMLEKAIQYNYQRAMVFITIRLVAIDLDRGNLESAAEKLSKIGLKAYEHQDRRYIAEIQRLYARLHTLHGDLPAARAALAEAIDLYERLGMRRELAEARAELADLETRAGAAVIG
jgi:tetratricopeptide repeat protein